MKEDHTHICSLPTILDQDYSEGRFGPFGMEQAFRKFVHVCQGIGMLRSQSSESSILTTH